MKKWRKKNKYTLTKASEVVGLPLNIISKLERGKIKPTHPISLKFKKVGINIKPAKDPYSPKVKQLHRLLKGMLCNCNIYIDECDQVITITAEADNREVSTTFSKYNLEIESNKGLKNQALGLARELVCLYDRRCVKSK